jgi:alpha-D-ribose 1-methylphosphonate 5-triphosphate synthase subunit PhnH
MNAITALAHGLTDAVHDSQQAFRQVLDALARPGSVKHVGPALPGVALGGAMARLLLSLCDDETPVWWQSEDATLASWLRFHTGAPSTVQPHEAAFAVLADAQGCLSLADFCAGTDASPEYSTTVLIELPALTGGPVVQWSGPGIQTVQSVALQGLPSNFWGQWQANHAAFPQGVDVVFTCGESALGLPRTTRVSRLEGI